MAEIVTIESLGHRGDGIARGPDGPLYVPFTLPGERVRIERNGERARAIEVLEPSPERVEPACRHFGTCGGCSLQMLSLEAAQVRKRDFVVAALKQQGLSSPVDATIGVGLGTRRRAVLTATNVGGRVMLGYHERLSHRLVDVEECPVLSPEITSRLPALRDLLLQFLRSKKPARVTVLVTMGGLDVAVSDAATPDASRITRLVELATNATVARLSINGEPILSLAEPVIEISDVRVVPPPGGFVQASAEAEAAMVGLVAEHLRGAKRVADLFSGVGAFALALARNASVDAYDSNEAALELLHLSVRRTKNLKPVTANRRDLFAFPLSSQELERYDGIVFDPPHAGAQSQAIALGASKVKRVAAVSCNPATFARDARILVDGGYQLERVVPIDQFVYSAETEVVGLFCRRGEGGDER
jgi:23S rRNA (uracil1939-C5)-methyltransferase